MDLKNEYEIGDTVICISGPDFPNFINTKWVIKKKSGWVCICMNEKLCDVEGFVFSYNEIVPTSSLIEELL